MEKKLPKVFANSIDKKLNNNETVFYEKSDRQIIEKVDTKKDVSKKIILDETFTINQKINKIFGSSRYVYKADVDITLKNGKVSKKVIGRNKNELITMDNELIKIADIVDIDFSNK